MSDKESQDLPIAPEPVTKPLGIGTPRLEPNARKKHRNQQPGVPVEIVKDVVAAAQVIRDNHKAAFLADRKLKDRAARLFRTLLPPRPRRPGRKPLASVTVAIRLVQRFKSEDPVAKPEQIWAKVYPKAIPNYASLANEVRWNEQRRLRERVHGRKRQQQRDRKKEQRPPDKPLPARPTLLMTPVTKEFDRSLQREADDTASE